MTTLDIILLPAYILLFYFYFKERRNHLQDAQLKKYHRQAFWLKVFASILFVIYYTYLTGGDSRSLYYREGYHLYQGILSNFDNINYLFKKGTEMDPNLLASPGNMGYLSSEANFMVIRITALLCFVTFGSYAVINLIFGFFALTGLWKLFMFFYDQRPAMHKGFAISILFFPSVVFWSAGLLKDSLCIGSLGWMTYSLYQILRGKQLLKSGAMLYLSVYMLAIVKVYILLAYTPFLLLYLLIIKLRSVRLAFFKYVLTSCIIVSSIFIFSKTYDSYDDELDSYAIENLTSTISDYNAIYNQMSFAGREGTESNFRLGAEFDGTFTGLLKIAPYALVATFYRPFIWETNKVSQIMAAIESIIMIFFTLIIFLRAGPFRLWHYILSDPLCIFCLLFALVFGLFVGSSTLNFGTLVRYKIPCMPFYAISLFLIHQKVLARRSVKIQLVKTPKVAVA